MRFRDLLRKARRVLRHEPTPDPETTARAIRVINDQTLYLFHGGRMYVTPKEAEANALRWLAEHPEPPTA